jgi:hypothetical protein
MTIDENVSTFAGLPVRAFEVSTADPDWPGAFAWRVTTDYEDGESGFRERFENLVAQPWADQVQALIIGSWGESYESAAPIEELAAAADRLTGLRALFLGEMTSEENEISWIEQGDIAAILQAYPQLEVLRVRGSTGLALTAVRHERLRELALESGGLPAAVIAQVVACGLPALRHLELWLGTDQYGGDATVDDLTPVLTGSGWPQLEYLGLRDAEIADQVAAGLAAAPVVARLSTLDLSLGLLTDVGATALLAGQPLTHLRRLDLHHHFLSEALQARLRDELEPYGVELDLSQAQGADREDRRFIAVSE